MGREGLAVLDGFGLDRAGGDPLYVQLAATLRGMIARGELDRGAALPSERLLSDRTGASRVTVRKAIAQLVGERLLTRRQGAGTYIAGGIEQPGAALTGFTDDAARRGTRPTSVWILRAISTATGEEAALLRLRADAPVARLGRIRLADGEPLAIEHAVVPQRFLPSIDLVDHSLYAALAQTGSRPVIARQRLTASIATPIEAGLLSIGEGGAVLRIERRGMLADGTPVELTRSAYRGDRYTFVSDLTETED